MLKKMIIGTGTASLSCLTLFSMLGAPVASAHCNSFDFNRVTGGGFVTSCSGGRNSFGFNITPDLSTNQLTVHLEYNDHQKNTDPIQIHVDTTTSLTDAQAQDVELPDETDIGIDFYVMADVRTSSGDYQEKVHVTVADYGEPGTNDQFHLEVVSGPDAGYSSGSPTIAGGNIQIHY